MKQLTLNVIVFIISLWFWSSPVLAPGKTNVNEVNDLFDRHIENKDQLMRDLKAEALKPRPRLQIFVSHSIPISLLKRYAREAIKYKGVLVLRGLPAGSFHKLSKLVSDISGDDAEGIAMQIDDEAFKAFNIKIVPTIVLSRSASIFSEQVQGGAFDKVGGNVTIRYALELFAKEGDLKENARELLK